MAEKYMHVHIYICEIPPKFLNRLMKRQRYVITLMSLLVYACVCVGQCLTLKFNPNRILLPMVVVGGAVVVVVGGTVVGVVVAAVVVGAIV